MMRKLLTTVAAIAIASGIAGGVAWSVNLPLFSNIALQEPSQELAALNTLVNAINFGTSGNLGYIGVTSSLATTVQQNFASTTIATGQLTSAGQGIHARCSGITPADTNTKVFDIIIFANGQTAGSISANAPIVSTNSIATASANWDVEMNYFVNTSPVTANGSWVGRSFVSTGTGGASIVSPLTVNVGQDTNNPDNLINNGLVIQCQYKFGSATNDATMTSFQVDQIK